MTDLERIAAGYRKMPSGGAALNVTADGAVANGYWIVARFPSKSAAEQALRQAGFTPHSYGWKLRA